MPMFWLLSRFSIFRACFFCASERIRMLCLQMPFVFFRVLIISEGSFQGRGLGFRMRIFWKYRVSIVGFGGRSKFKLWDRAQALHAKVMLPAWVRLKAAPVSVSKQGYRGQFGRFCFILYTESY